MDNKTVREKFDQFMMPNYQPSKMIPSRGKGARLWDVEGKEYVDLSGGIAVTSLGHCPPELVKTLQEQSEKVWHISNIHTSLEAVTLAEKLVKHTFADKVFLCNSGAEANEAALKLARRYAHDNFGEEKDEIISFDQSFHGRTFFTVAVGGQEKYRKGFGPLPGGLTYCPFNDIAAIEKLVSDKTCAIIVEPVQGEGGIYNATPAFLKRLRELCDRHNAVLIFDEVQTGMGRCGHLFAYEATGVKPDILTSAKGIGGGFPVAAVLAVDKVAKSFVFGCHGSTYGGNPLACSIANKVIDIVSDPKLLEGVREKRKIFEKELMLINEKYPFFDEIRGMGLLIGLGLKSQFKGKAKEFVTAGIEEGVIFLQAGLDTIRFAPPLNIEEKDIHEGMKRFAEMIRKKLG